jgi:asparagine synthase (glutamine-hydrolysing)
MSGIVGMVSLGGAPVDERLLRQMTDSLTYRGPDRQETWFDGPVGFGHTLLRTTIESEHDAQPGSLDGRVWITADARVDGRADLVDRLASRGRKGLRAASDAQLILHAYHAWGEDCVEHLLGDFAFAIWDGPARRLFCARDHFGIKPFYYAHIDGAIVFSNTLNCVRLHPGVGDALNELAIADFLLFGFNQEPATTTFADVRRLPAAHSFTCEDGTLRPRRYWTVPTDGRIRYRRSHEYVDRFKELLWAAVDDRLRTSHVGVWMSGGLDSTSIAATARQILCERGTPFDLRADTVGYDSLIPDEERDYAEVAAKALGLSINYLAADGYRPFEGWDQPELSTPEPTGDPFLLIRIQQLKQTASHCRVLLCGEGGDEILRRSYVVDLLGKMRLRELGSDIARALLLHRRRPAAGVRARVKQWLGHRVRLPPYPGWLNRAFAERLNLRGRWQEATDRELRGDHPLRPEACQRLAPAPWSWYFESSDPGVTRIPAEGRYPFLDVRLVSYLLAIPPIPWCIDKQVLRIAMCDVLPDSIRLRAKAPLAVDPLMAHLRQEADGGCLDRFDPVADLDRWVERAAVPPLAGGRDAHESWLNVRPLCLNHWLRRNEGISHGHNAGEFRERRTCQETVCEPAAGGLRRHS